MVSYINETFIESTAASIPVNDLGLQRGYGVFDFLRVKGQQPFFLQQHIDRLYRSLELMRLHLSYSKEELINIIQSLIDQNQLSHSGIRITVTGGASPDGYTPVDPHLIIVQQSIPEPPQAMLTGPYKLVTYQYRRQLPEVKTTDYLMAIWLQPWVKEQGAHDVLYHDNGWVSECPRSNFFIITKENVLVTPHEGMLKGVTRSNILKVAKGIMKVEERAVSLEDIRSAKEAFISSSTKRLIPVTGIDDVVFNSYDSDCISRTLFEALALLEASKE
ncbi:branched-chain-amino-acid transaminase [Sediminibacterium sp. KACHI17]|jgi:D-alanine transaminase/branched-chain amino acid aminotransferase|uniref:branched-chain-amino-acid transaminase n=1 Tax=Sediminibacterium sp. KACHI17 TaxID=1751071 RepID=A0AAT9GK27_9BACT